MQSDRGKAVNERFFEAWDYLIGVGVIKNKDAFFKKYNIDKRNFYKARKKPESKIFDLGWLTIFVSRYNISSEWLCTGKRDRSDEKKNYIPVGNLLEQIRNGIPSYVNN